MMASERLIVPCSSDGSSVRAIGNLGILLYGIGNASYPTVQLKSRADQFKMPLPLVHSIVLQSKSPQSFVSGSAIFDDIPDSHSVAIVCSHNGIPLFGLNPGKYQVYEENPQVNPEPLNRYRDAVASFIEKI